jgi:hypothetical protein
VLRLMEIFPPGDVEAGIRSAIARGVIGFDAVKHLVLCRIERRPPRLELLSNLVFEDFIKRLSGYCLLLRSRF